MGLLWVILPVVFKCFVRAFLYLQCNTSTQVDLIWMGNSLFHKGDTESTVRSVPRFNVRCLMAGCDHEWCHLWGCESRGLTICKLLLYVTHLLLFVAWICIDIHRYSCSCLRFFECQSWFWVFGSTRCSESYPQKQCLSFKGLLIRLRETGKYQEPFAAETLISRP